MRTLTLLSLILSAGCLRLPKWLHNPLQLTNIPLLPAMDLGRPCFSGGEEGVCTLPRQCLGERTVAGPCTIFKSVCCMESLTCNNTISQTVGRFTNPGYPDREVEALATCSLSVMIRPETCLLRLRVRQLQLRAGEEGRCVR